MGRKWKDRPLLDDYRNFPVQFGLLEEVGYLVDRCTEFEEAADRREARLVAEKITTYTDILAELNATLDLYLDLKATSAAVAQLLPSRGRLGGMIETQDTVQLKSEVSRLQGKARRLTGRVANIRKNFWTKVLEIDPELYPYDPDHFAAHMQDIEQESFEL
ncbi:hypothetical protein BG53_09065 [Paenibacillus darwinianus]|uniref:Uncharacterized protein n=1 Tax=Paenibacillus darwinianus TaxID=1380763 RepID=A0A9W5RZL8_9BACL|nr:hypothetical protein [Paenibacillus darwinianus]EXX84610.1 hypothetical protein CH50_11400 [Paenibacillus darwinianus]EXX85187.1 hypothetical protein BG52_08995 [Paenibacillus darwinianus]EXX85248.1 hypothetical protein BG53_09065 [Paenibacillus darwinianus]